MTWCYLLWSELTCAFIVTITLEDKQLHEICMRTLSHYRTELLHWLGFSLRRSPELRLILIYLLHSTQWHNWYDYVHCDHKNQTCYSWPMRFTIMVTYLYWYVWWFVCVFVSFSVSWIICMLGKTIILPTKKYANAWSILYIYTCVLIWHTHIFVAVYWLEGVTDVAVATDSVSGVVKHYVP